MRRTLATSVSLLALLGVLLTACGSDDSDSSKDSKPAAESDSGSGDSGDSSSDLSGSEAEYADAISEQFKSDPSSDLPITDDQAECLAGEMVQAIGVDTLESAGVEPDDIINDSESFDQVALNLSEEQAGDLVDAMFDGGCIDFAELMAAEIVASSDGQLTEEQGQCIGEAFISDSAFKDILVRSMLGDESADPSSMLGSMMSVFADCGVDMTSLGG